MTLAAIDSGGVWIEGATRRTTLGPRKTAAQLFASMRARGVDVLYAHRSALGQLELPPELPDDGTRLPHPFTAGKPLAPSLTDDDAEVLIGAYQGGAGDPFEDAADGRELLAAAVAFRDAFATRTHPNGWAYRHSACTTGVKLMHAPWSYGPRAARLGESLRERELLDLDGLEPGAQTEVPFGAWAVSLLTRLKPQDCLPYVHAWDINGQRLAACGRLELGVGPTAEASPTDFDTTLPGYHLIESVAHPFEIELPPIMSPGWHTTPRVAMAKYLGLEPVIERSIVWPQHVAYLDPFYSRMRSARAALLGRGDRAGALALRALKQAYLEPLGRLRSWRARESHSLYYRPSWYDAVIGQELARQYLRLHELARAGVPVLAIYFDAIVVESDEPDVARAAPAAIEVSSQLGKFKPVGSLEAERARELLWPPDRDKPNVSALIEALREPAAPHPPAVSTLTSVGASAGSLSAYDRPVHGGYPTIERTAA